MYDAPQRLSVVLEHEDDEWAVVAVLINERGERQRSTLGRFTRRADAADHLKAVYGALPKKKAAG